MPKIEFFLQKIPDHGLLICGRKGEFWTEWARFSSKNPLIMPPVFDMDNLKSSLSNYSGGLFKGLFIAWGLSRIMQNRQDWEKLINLLDGGGQFLGVEAVEGNMSLPARNHLNYLKFLYRCDFLPPSRIINVLKSVGLTQIRSQEYLFFEGLWPEKAVKDLKERVETELKKANSTESKNFISSIEQDGLEPSPFIFFSAVKRSVKISAEGTASGNQRSHELAQRGNLRKRLLELGVVELEEEDLLSVLLDCEPDLARKILYQYGGKSLLKERDLKNISSILGIDDVRAINLLAILELGRRLFEPHPENMPIIHSPQEAYEYLSDMKDLRREHLRGLYLNIKGKLIWDEVISIGTLSKALVTPREILAPAIERGASGIIVAHNHLSGVAEPSSEDLEMTIQIENAAELMKLDLWDHIIITQNGYYSFNEAGKIKCAIQAGKFGKGKK